MMYLLFAIISVYGSILCWIFIQIRLEKKLDMKKKD